MNIQELINNGGNVQIVVTPEDLKEFALAIMEDARNMERERMERERKADERLSSRQVCEQYEVSYATLWRWTKIKYLKPHKLGMKNYYMRSDIEKIIKG